MAKPSQAGPQPGQSSQTATYTQKDRPLVVKFQRLGDDALLLERFSGTEGISTLFSFTLDLLAPANTAIDFRLVLGDYVSVNITDASRTQRWFHGICSRFRQGATVNGTLGPLVCYHAEMVPLVWLLTRKVQSRIFQNQSVVEILQAVFKGFFVSFEALAPFASFAKRTYCVQYNESDFAFASRLMEEEGIAYHFFHQQRTHQLMLTNQNFHFRKKDGTLAKHVPSSGGAFIDGWEKEQRVCADAFDLRDYSFGLSTKILEKTKKLTPSINVEPGVTHTLTRNVNLETGEGGASALEVYDYPGGFGATFDGVDASGQKKPAELEKVYDYAQRLVDLRMQQEASQSVRIDGNSNSALCEPGFTIAVTENGADHGTYLLTRIAHQADLGGSYHSGKPAASSFVYKNQFTCVPDALTYRPERSTPRPRILGTQTAVVVGPTVGGISTDMHGRVKVRFHWDREAARDRIDPTVDNTSCWIRVLQPRAGQGWGSIELPRVGQEVVVDFLDGDPDRPIILGSVYNDEQTPPYPLPAEVSVSGIKSRSLASKKPEEFNEVRLDDKPGAELVVIQAQKDFSSTVKNNAAWDIRANSFWNTSVNADWDVGKNARWNIRNNDIQYVGASKTLVVGLGGWFQPPLFIVPPSFSSFIYAACSEIAMPVRTQIVLGSLGLSFIDPSDYAVNKKLRLAMIPGLKTVLEAATLLTGRTDFIYGNETRIQYGALHRDFVRGQKFHSVLKFSSENPILSVLTGLHLALLTTAMTLPAVAFKLSPHASPSFTSGEVADQIMAAQGIVSVCATATQLVLKLLEKRERVAKNTAMLVAHAAKVTTLGTPVITSFDGLIDLVARSGKIALIPATLAAATDGDFYQEVEDTYYLQSKNIYLLSSDGDISQTAPGGEAFTAAKQVTTLAETKVLVAGQTVRIEGGGMLGSQIKVDGQGITLSCAAGMNSIKVSNSQVIIRCGASSLTLDAAKIGMLTQMFNERAVANVVG